MTFALKYLDNTIWLNLKFSFLIILGPTSGGVVALKTGRRESPGSNPVRDCQPSRAEFSVVFSETRVNTG